MSDATDNAVNGQSAGQPQSPVTLNGQYLKDLSFGVPNAPGIFGEIDRPPEVTVSVNVEARRYGENTFEGILLLNVEGKLKEKTAFIVEVTYCALVTLHMPEEHIEPFLMIEVPRLVFPFARAIIADATRDSGFPPLVITPIDFVALYRQRLAQAQEATQAGHA